MKNLEELELHGSFDVLETLVAKMVRILGSTDLTNRGGYFCLANDCDPPNDHHRSLRRFGQVIDDRAFEHYRLSAEEKVVRLLTEARGDLTSWRSRDPSMQRFGGGIRVNSGDIGMVMAFDGFFEHCNEALMLAFAINMKWLVNKDAFAMAANDQVAMMIRRLFAD